ncbi:MAG: hypothetical protein GF401_18765 [Chitinivibrionales bacterium]|nr:hypothetical protein [Chitinivibrionales bacterium]
MKTSKCLLLALIIAVLMPRAIQARQGNVLTLDGVDDYVRIPHSASLDITSEITMIAWVNISTYLEYAPILFKGGNDDPNALTTGGSSYGIIQSGVRKGTSAGKLRISCPSTRQTETSTMVRPSTWTHIAVTYDASEGIKVYFDGALESEFPPDGEIASSTSPLFFGVEFTGGDEFWDGQLDEIMVFNRVLSESDIGRAMNNQLSASADGLVGFWQFENLTGDSVYDSSPMNNHGLLYTSPVEPGPRPDYQPPEYPSPVPKTDIENFVFNNPEAITKPEIHSLSYSRSSGSITLSCKLPQETTTGLFIFNCKGRQVFSTYSLITIPGYSQQTLDLGNIPVGPGHIAVLKSGTRSICKKITVIQ